MCRHLAGDFARMLHAWLDSQRLSEVLDSGLDLSGNFAIELIHWLSLADGERALLFPLLHRGVLVWSALCGRLPLLRCRCRCDLETSLCRSWGGNRRIAPAPSLR